MLRRQFSQARKRLLKAVGSKAETSVASALEQSPNRATPWSLSQAAREEVVKKPTFLGKDITTQPRPYAAIELIAQQPVRFLNDRIAVCQGDKQGGQGHPKVYINLEPKRAHPCGYCGLRFAMEEYKADIDH